MSGHSKWAQIKHKKAATDQKRGQLFSKLSKVISLAARKGTNPDVNSDLKNAIDNARSYNMPNDSIERALKKASDKSAALLEELSIEAIGPGGIALKIWVITDNKSRAISEIKNILAENSSKMVPQGSISWMFNQPVVVEDQVIHDQIDKLFNVLNNNEDVEDIVSNLHK